QFVQAGGKWTGSVLASADRVPAVKLEGLSVTAERLRFALRGDKQTFTVDARVPKESAKVIKGSVTLDDDMVPCDMTATALTTLKPFELFKDVLTNEPDNPEIFMSGLTLLSMAEKEKAKPEEVRGWAEKLWKAAEPYGLRWQQEMAVGTADILNQQEGYAPIALAYAQRAERLLEPKDAAVTKKRVLSRLARALEKSGKPDESKEVQARVAKLDTEVKAEEAKLEAQADEEYLKKMPPFKAEPFAGRKSKSNRAVLAELFTGAQCPPCVAADLAFDGLAKTYKPTDVVLLQYHTHIPRADPLTNLDTEDRLEYYKDEIEGTPALLLDGKLGHGEGGGIGDSEKVYEKYRKLIDALLEKPARASLELSAVRRGKKIEINAEASEVTNPSEDVRLRFVLVEENARYVGSNGIRFHHHVVRAMPGGEKGYPLKQKTTRQAASVDLDELKKQLTQYVNAVAKKSQATFPEPEQILALKNLRVVAFVQNDKTKEVLQAKEVEVNGARE
ncbi:MAG TPA: hypothetical protein VKE94_19945, partial [Gemmataceae bacterium]|nr:hypothetical protein [Gemmataceae bacterium]